jgi:hypothetical protein
MSDQTPTDPWDDLIKWMPFLITNAEDRRCVVAQIDLLRKRINTAHRAEEQQVKDQLIDALWALRQCHTVARRNLTRLWHTGATPDQLFDWERIASWCEAAGASSAQGVLRVTADIIPPPAEIAPNTEGTSETQHRRGDGLADLLHHAVADRGRHP